MIGRPRSPAPHSRQTSPPKDQDLPFFRGENSRNRDTGGIGLGLSVAHSIVLAHGGEITLTNRPEGGLRVCVELPCQAAA